MSARAFADTNVLICAQGSDSLKAQRAIEIIEAMPVISTQVGPRIVFFEACSAFTCVTACTLALPPYVVTRFTRRVQRFVTSIGDSHWIDGEFSAADILHGVHIRQGQARDAGGKP